MATFTFAPSVAKFAASRETYLAKLQASSPEPLYGLATGAIIFKKQDAPGDSEPRVLLVQRSPTDSMPLKWEIPGGAVDAGETILEGAVREAREETGLEVVRIEELVVHDEAGGSGEGLDRGYLIRTTRGKRIVKFTFLVEVTGTGRVRLDPTEHADYVWATEAECRAKRAVGEDQGRGERTVALDFTTAAQEATIFNAFALRKSEKSA